MATTNSSAEAVLPGTAPSALETGLRISPRVVLVILWCIVPALYLVGEALSFPDAQLERLLVFCFPLYALSAGAWLLVSWRPLLGRWSTVAAVVVAVHLGGSWLGEPGLLAFIALPIVLSAALVDSTCAAVTAAVQTVLVILLPTAAVTDGGLVTTTTILIAIWATFGVVYAMHRSTGELNAWVDEYFVRAQRFLAEARDRRVEMEQVSQSLANASRQLALANQRMAELRSIAEEAQRAKSAFVAKVSHGFRTPLNMIIGLAELMVESPGIYDVSPSPKMREDLQVIYRNSELLSAMVDDVLDLTRVEAGLLALHREWVDLRDVVEDSATTISPLLNKKRLALSVVAPDDLPAAYCDRMRIQQVILNLMSNAARFTEEGGIAVEIAAKGHHLLVSVADTGPGISLEDSERIFEPFRQGRVQMLNGKGGSGLGLSISRQFVRLHGGRIWVESKPGVGTTFFFTLPTALPVEHILRPGYQIREDWVWREGAFKAGQIARADQLTGPRVVICDRTGDLYAELTRCFDEVEFVDARDPAQATDVLQECPAHAVMVNAASPEDLWDAIETLRRGAPQTPIIGCSVPRPIERAVAAGAMGHLVKPVTRADLKEAIRATGKPVRRVLVVDDDLDALHLFERMLRASDATLEVLTASSGQQALAELQRATPDLILLDIVMPDMDGWQVLESMQRSAQAKTVPAFFVSAQDIASQPPKSSYLVAAIGEGLPLSKLLRCSLALSSHMLRP